MPRTMTPRALRLWQGLLLGLMIAPLLFAPMKCLQAALARNQAAQDLAASPAQGTMDGEEQLLRADRPFLGLRTQPDPGDPALDLAILLSATAVAPLARAVEPVVYLLFSVQPQQSAPVAGAGPRAPPLP